MAALPPFVGALDLKRAGFDERGFSMKRMLIGSLAALSLACGESVMEANVDDSFDGDDTHGSLTFEGDEVVNSLDARGISAPIAARTFVRLGLIWESADPSAIEVRVSQDGRSWTDWAQPLVVHSEEGLHSGYVESPVAGEHFQYRVREGMASPSFVWFDPIDQVGPALDLPERPELAALDGDDDGVMLLERPASIETGQLQQQLASNPRIHSRSEARAPRCRSSTSPYRVTVHHTVTPTNDSISPQARLRAIQAYHMDARGYCDIGYNFLISRDGRVWRGRGRLTLGAHTANNNSGNVGIAFMGTHGSTRLTSTQVCRGGQLLAFLRRNHSSITLDRQDVKGHRQYGAAGGGTSCPGDALYRQLDEIIAKARNGC